MLAPVRDLVLVEKIENERTTSSGIVVGADPTEATKSKVIAVGPKVSDQLQVGDIIILDYNKAARTKYDGKEYYFVAEANIIGVLEI